MRFCRKGKVNEGPWTAWEDKYKNIDGEYKNGREHGIWVWWNKDGTKYRAFEYREGIEIRNEVLHRNE
ncbi:MAG TPA: hypothetical protein VH681_11385 [Nitrospiraceae bacterium]